MSLRWKIALAMAAIVAVAAVLVGSVTYRLTRDRLLAEVDRSLVELDGFVNEAQRRPQEIPDRGPLPGFDVQFLRANGAVGRSTFPEAVEPSEAELSTIGQPRRSIVRTSDTDGGEFRIRTVGFQRGAVQVGRSLDETNRVLMALRNRILLLVVVVAMGAAAAGFWIAGRVTASLRRLTGAAEQVGRTGRLDVEIDSDGSDEVGRLGAAFDGMLSALARSRDEQHRLVQDAGHELRTPLTSIRANVDVLRRHPTLDEATRDAVLDDLRAETAELGSLVDEIVTAASGEAAREPAVAFDLAEVTTEVARRYERRTGRPVVVEAVPSPVVGQRGGVQRAVSCLLDNAQKFDGSAEPIEVIVREHTVVVADRGPGIPDDELALVFERFHRADDARPMPGSGLGLSIVRDVARRHGGDAFARNRSGGGAEVGFEIISEPSIARFSPGSHLDGS